MLLGLHLLISAVGAANLAYVGRFAPQPGGGAQFDWSGSQVLADFVGTSLSVRMADRGNNLFNVVIDGKPSSVITTSSGVKDYQVASGLPSGAHTVVLTKRTEANVGGVVQVLAASLNSGAWEEVHFKPTAASRRVEWIGDSITCGYGNLGKTPCGFTPQTEDITQTYGFMVSNHFEAEAHIVAWSGKGVVRNYGYHDPTSPDPMPLYYPSTLGNNLSATWSFSRWVPDAVVINLGTNDFSTQPVPSQAVFAKGYKDLLAVIRRVYPSTTQIFVVCGPLIGGDCCRFEQQIVSEANSGGDSRVHYVDMQNILVGGGGPPDYGCDWHPSVAGHTKMANILTPALGKVMGW